MLAIIQVQLPDLDRYLQLNKIFSVFKSCEELCNE